MNSREYFEEYWEKYKEDLDEFPKFLVEKIFLSGFIQGKLSVIQNKSERIDIED